MSKGKIYSIKNEEKILPTTQTSVVIPTAELIKNKKVDLRVLACVSAISNVDDWTKEGGNVRYCTVQKLNNNLSNISKLLDVNRTVATRKIKQITEVESEEFKIVRKNCDGKDTSCIEIKYGSGGFVIIDVDALEGLISGLSNNAFKLYTNLLWICRDNARNVFVERQLTQEFLLELIGLSKSSKRLLKKAEEELVSKNLIKVSLKWDVEFNKDFTTSIPVSKKYYKIINT